MFDLQIFLLAALGSALGSATATVILAYIFNWNKPDAPKLPFTKKRPEPTVRSDEVIWQESQKEVLPKGIS